MLSKTEIEFLKNPERFGADYRRVMRHRVKAKAEEFRAQITLLQGCGAFEGTGLSVTENCNGVTEFCNGEQSSKQADFNKGAPGMGFEPMRTRRSTGSQGPRINRSAIPALFLSVMSLLVYFCFCLNLSLGKG